jgi:hypothetical protein
MTVHSDNIRISCKCGGRQEQRGSKNQEAFLNLEPVVVLFYSRDKLITMCAEHDVYTYFHMKIRQLVKIPFRKHMLPQTHTEMVLPLENRTT